jgi:hypothetical protein
LKERRRRFQKFYQTVDAFGRSSKKIYVPDGREESLDESCLGHTGKWKLE